MNLLEMGKKARSHISGIEEVKRDGEGKSRPLNYQEALDGVVNFFKGDIKLRLSHFKEGYLYSKKVRIEAKLTEEQADRLKEALKGKFAYGGKNVYVRVLQDKRDKNDYLIQLQIQL